jgi:hypothetical protein
MECSLTMGAMETDLVKTVRPVAVALLATTCAGGTGAAASVGGTGGALLGQRWWTARRGWAPHAQHAAVVTAGQRSVASEGAQEERSAVSEGAWEPQPPYQQYLHGQTLLQEEAQ